MSREEAEAEVERCAGHDCAAPRLLCLLCVMRWRRRVSDVRAEHTAGLSQLPTFLCD